VSISLLGFVPGVSLMSAVLPLLDGGRAGYAGGTHGSEMCHPAPGWEILDSGAPSVPLDDEKPQARLYWFEPPGRGPARSGAEQLGRLPDAVAGCPRCEFVRPSAHDGGNLPILRNLDAPAPKAPPATPRPVEGSGGV
jgi:hypothetical protein